MDTKALRQKVLDLAIRGKLVPQDPNDEPASVLLERIRQQKQQMVKDGKLKAKDIKNDTVIFVGEDNLHYEKFADGSVKCIEDEIPFEVPEGWVWTRFASIADISLGKMLDAVKNKGYAQKYLRNVNVRWGAFDMNDVLEMRFKEDEFDRFSIVKGDLVVCEGGEPGRCAIWDSDEAIFYQKALHRVRPISVLSEFIYYAMRTFIGAGIYDRYYTGTTIKHLTGQSIKILPIPLPPLNEQKRLTEQLNKLQLYIDAIELDKNDVITLIDQTKSRILDLAIRGQLVPQDPTDEPASVLLERIREEKEELIRQGRIKRDKKESVIFRGEDNSYYEKIGDYVRCIDSELPFELPDSWMFVRLKHIGEVVGGGTPKTNISEYWDGNIPWLTPADFSGYEEMYVSSGARTITEIGLKSSSAQMLPANSVLYSSRAPIGYIAIAANPVSTNQGFKSVVPYDFSMSPYLYYCLKARTDDIIQRATGTTFKEISGSEMAETIIPLPPFTEQKRLVAKATQLLNVITTIEKSLS